MKSQDDTIREPLELSVGGQSCGRFLGLLIKKRGSEFFTIDGLWWSAIGKDVNDVIKSAESMLFNKSVK